jgi:hypothetical protein
MTANELKILGDIVSALRDQNKKVQIETIDRKIDGNILHAMDTPQLPDKYNQRNGPFSLNQMYATGIKIGPDISVKLVPGKSGEGHWVARTPAGEAKFTRIDDDFITIWRAALNDNANGWGASYDMLTRYLKAPELRAIAGGRAALETNQTKFEKSAARLAKIGVEKGKKSGVILADMIAAQKQNG